MPGLELNSPVRFVPGVGPFRGEKFHQAGIRTVLDLLQISPTRYEILPACKPLGQWQAGEVACIAGEITSVRWAGSRSKPVVVARIRDGDESARISWFNLPRLRSQLAVGMVLCATGKIQFGDDEAEMTNPIFQYRASADDLTMPDQGRLRAVYSSVGTLDSKAISKTISGCLTQVRWPEHDLPRGILERRKLLTLPQAISQIHQPDSQEHAERARRRLAYDELLLWQVQFLRIKMKRRQGATAPALEVTPEIDRRIRRRLPFSLTPAQNKVVAQISRDISSTEPMVRLLQGDVGCGKTAVAIYAALVAVANRHQAALLAPTEILAEQHFEKARSYLEGSAVRIALSASSIGAAARSRLKSALAAGEIDLVIGTHALLEPDIKFHRLGLVIIDEQHRFGVEQRKALKTKGASPHYLVMSATPIPRTQTLAWMGDLDVSVIDEMPAGPRRVDTRIVSRADLQRAWATVRAGLDGGGQAYVVLPLIDDSDKLELRSVNSEIERLRAAELRGYRCAILHGRLTSAEKQKVIDDFRTGAIQVLVTTTVIEVGVDVPNATMMAVFHAERYGLAQLHQLRGRIGRAGDQAHMFLFLERRGSQAYQRLRILETTTDGFEIAAADLQLRGPGQIMGTEQHGIPTYKFANLATDIDLLEAAKEDARSFTQDRPASAAGSSREEFAQLEPELSQYLQQRHPEHDENLVHVA